MISPIIGAKDDEIAKGPLGSAYFVINKKFIEKQNSFSYSIKSCVVSIPQNHPIISSLLLIPHQPPHAILSQPPQKRAKTLGNKIIDSCQARLILGSLPNRPIATIVLMPVATDK